MSTCKIVYLHNVTLDDFQTIDGKGWGLGVSPFGYLAASLARPRILTS